MSWSKVGGGDCASHLDSRSPVSLSDDGRIISLWRQNWDPFFLPTIGYRVLLTVKDHLDGVHCHTVSMDSLQNTFAFFLSCQSTSLGCLLFQPARENIQLLKSLPDCAGPSREKFPFAIYCNIIKRMIFPYFHRFHPHSKERTGVSEVYHRILLTTLPNLISTKMSKR